MRCFIKSLRARLTGARGCSALAKRRPAGVPADKPSAETNWNVTILSYDGFR